MEGIWKKRRRFAAYILRVSQGDFAWIPLGDYGVGAYTAHMEDRKFLRMSLTELVTTTW